MKDFVWAPFWLFRIGFGFCKVMPFSVWARLFPIPIGELQEAPTPHSRTRVFSSTCIALLCSVLLTGCFQFRLTEKEIYKAFEGAEHQPVLAEYVEQDRNMHYLAVNSEADSLPLIVFIHGAPGSRSVFLKLLTDSTLASRARMVSVDRAGYGESGFGKAETSIEKQAALIRPLIERYSNEQPTYLVGYSFGGPIAVRALMDNADLADGMVLVSGALDPEHEKIYWVSYPGNWFFIRWMLPRAVRVTNKEKLSHVAQLTHMLPYWGKVEVPTTVIQGLDDKLVVPENAHFAIRQLTGAKTELILVPNQKHRIPHDQPHIVKNALLEFLGK